MRLLWANWQEPNLHDQLVHLPGVTACIISADAHALAFTYQPNVVMPAQVR